MNKELYIAVSISVVNRKCSSAQTSAASVAALSARHGGSMVHVSKGGSLGHAQGGQLVTSQSLAKRCH